MPLTEPRYQIEEMVGEIIGRRDQAISEMHEELQKLLLGVVDQMVLLKKRNSTIDLCEVKLSRIRWVNDHGDSRLVMDITCNGRPMRPEYAGYY